MARRCWLLFGLWAAVATVLQNGPRFEKAVDLFFALAVIAAAGTSRAVATKIIGGLVALQSVLAGVTAAISVDEAMDLVAGVIVVGAIGFGLWLADRRPPAGRHQRA